MTIVPVEIQSANVELDKPYCLYCIQCTNCSSICNCALTVFLVLICDCLPVCQLLFLSVCAPVCFADCPAVLIFSRLLCVLLSAYLSILLSSVCLTLCTVCPSTRPLTWFTCKRCCGSETINFGSGSYLPGSYGSKSGSYTLGHDGSDTDPTFQVISDLDLDPDPIRF